MSNRLAGWPWAARTAPGDKERQSVKYPMRRLLPRLVITFLGYILLMTGILGLPTPPPMPKIFATILICVVFLGLPFGANFFVIHSAYTAASAVKIRLAAFCLSVLAMAGLFCWICFLRFGL